MACRLCSVERRRSSTCHTAPLELAQLTKSDTEVKDEAAAEHLGAVSSTIPEVIHSRRTAGEAGALAAPACLTTGGKRRTPVMGLIWVAAIVGERRLDCFEALWELAAVSEVFWFD